MPRARARSCSTRAAARGCPAVRAGAPGLQLPAFSAAMCPSVGPRYWVCPSPSAATAHARGCTTLVASRRPPRPTSITRTSTPRKARNAISVTISKNVSPGSPSAQGTRARTSSSSSQARSSEMGSPSSRMRSQKWLRCGLVYSPVRSPAARKADSANAQVDPLPLVPATCSAGAPRSGLPSSAQASCMRSSPSFTPKLPRAKSSSFSSAKFIGARSPAGSPEQAEELRQPLAHLLAVHDPVDHPVLEEELAPLKPLRQLLTDGLLDHARSGEADQRARLGEDDVAEEGKGGRHAAGGRVEQHADVRLLHVPEARQRRRGLRHLHQGEDGLLHARAAARREDDGRDPAI